MKRLLPVLLLLVLVLPVLACEKDQPEPLLPEFTDPGPVADLTWSLDATGTLTISGKGAMPDYIYMADVGGEQNYPPWYSRRRDILRVKLEPGLTRVGAMAFSGCSALWAVSLPEGIVEIGMEAFARTALEHCPLPESLEKIGSGAFARCAFSGELTLPDGLLAIDDHAFYDCRRLTEVRLPPRLFQLGKSVFNSCLALTTFSAEENPHFCAVDGVLFTADMATLLCYPPARAGEHYTVPDGVRGIANTAFRFCALTGIELPESLLRIGVEAFSNSAITSLVLPKRLLMIESYAFSNSSLTEIRIPDSILHLGNGIFSSCRALLRVTLPDGLETLPAQTFSWCTALCEINLPASLITIGSDAFLQCVSLTNLKMPDGLRRIDWSAFANCQSLQTLALPNRLIAIGRSAFAGCTALQQMHIPASVRRIDDTVFSGCAALTDITVAADNQDYRSHDGVLYTADGILLCYPSAKADMAYTVSDDTVEIAPYAFFENTFLQFVTMPEVLHRIGEGAFDHCTALIECHLPAHLTVIEPQTFMGCKSLQKITLPATLRQIGTNAFYGTPLNNILFTGTHRDWEKITIHPGNNSLRSDLIRFLIEDDMVDSN